jgi:drug/metabolite transporter (DMT)-like permease
VSCRTGVVLPLLQQSVMFFNIAFSRLVLRKKLAWQQYVGAAAVVVGVCFAALPEDGGTSIFAGVRTMFQSPSMITEDSEQSMLGI